MSQVLGFVTAVSMCGPKEMAWSGGRWREWAAAHILSVGRVLVSAFLQLELWLSQGHEGKRPPTLCSSMLLRGCREMKQRAGFCLLLSVSA